MTRTARRSESRRRACGESQDCNQINWVPPPALMVPFQIWCLICTVSPETNDSNNVKISPIRCRLYNVPWAINRMVTYMDKRYGRPDIWVLENGGCMFYFLCLLRFGRVP